MSSLAGSSGHKRQQASNDADRLSDLPESVRCHILSFLPTKDAVATSLLSRRWKFLWRDIRNLIFSDTMRLLYGDMNDENIKFAHFVNMVLIFLNQQAIHKFSLDINKYCELYNVSTWIGAAVARQVKVLQFCMNNSYPADPRIKLPCSLFTCKSLELLQLIGIISLNVPRSACFPNIRTLHLEGVNYECDESVCNLISGCSSLETLNIERDMYDNVVTFTISSPTLRSLTFRFYEAEDPFPKDLDYKLEINAPALVYLDLFDCLSRDFSVENLRSLDEAKIWTRHVKDEENVPLIGYDHFSEIVVKLLQGVYNVRHLSLRGDAPKALNRADLSLRFPRLTQLTILEAEYCYWNSLLNLFKSSNSLTFLNFSKGFMRGVPHVTSWTEPEKVPICLLSCLRKMSFYGFEGLEDELAMVAYVLQNSTFLRRMKIRAENSLGLEARFQLLQKVSEFPRGSKECKITFS